MSAQPLPVPQSSVTADAAFDRFFGADAHLRMFPVSSNALASIVRERDQAIVDVDQRRPIDGTYWLLQRHGAVAICRVAINLVGGRLNWQCQSRDNDEWWILTPGEFDEAVLGRVVGLMRKV